MNTSNSIMKKINKLGNIFIFSSIFILIMIVLYQYVKIQDIKKSFFTSQENVSRINKNLNIYEDLFKKKKYYEKTISSTNGKKFQLKKFFLGQINLGLKKDTYRWSYIDIYQNYFVVISASGQTFFTGLDDFNTNNVNLKKIDNNLQDLSPLNKTHNRLSIKDLLITKEGYIYVSYVKLTSNNCHNIAIAKAKIKFDELNFKEFFTFEECIELYDDGKNPSSQNGGRIVEYKDDKLLFTIGDFSTYILAQDTSSMFGKIFLINKNDPNKFEIFSVGHRNQQGLFYDEKNDRVFSAEHGPEGGDEFNEIILGKNYGWPNASYGTIKGEGLEKQKKYPNIITLYDNHRKYGFEEPIKFFTPSIGISQLIKNFNNREENNSYFITSMKNKELGHSIYIIDFDLKNIVNNEDKLFIGDRIRDIIYNNKDGEYILMLESSYSIGVLREVN